MSGLHCPGCGRHYDSPDEDPRCSSCAESGTGEEPRGAYPWLVLRGPGEMICQRCGATYQPALPAPINVYLAICKAFTNDHRKCKEREP